MSILNRRRFLATTAATAALTVPIGHLAPMSAWAAGSPPTVLRIVRRVIEVDGRPASVFGLLQPDGSHGLVTEAGKRFRVRLENRIEEPTLVHWHGLLPPYGQDGVPDLPQPPLPPQAAYDYDFPLERPGTNWMHAHHGLFEQQLMAAPLVVRDPSEAAADIQDVVVLFHDFTFRDPAEILAELRAGGGGHAMPTQPAQPAMGHGGMHGAGHGAAATAPAMHGGQAPMSMPHLHDVEYDAFLANDRTLADPAVFRVEAGGRVRLRLINGAAATNFWLDTGALQGRLVAVDGDPIEPIDGHRFPFAIAQRLDILIELPREQGAWPILALREGDNRRTGFVLATREGRIAKLPEEGGERTPPVGLDLERRLRASRPLAARSADRTFTLTLDEQPGYVWSLGGKPFGSHEPLRVRKGERVEVTLVNRTTMSHPMHLHGHRFQVVAIDGKRLSGAVRDTVLVPIDGQVTIAFDADNPGTWLLHCHQLYHMVAGMMTTIVYES
ncbi:Multicopper oxidase MmcO [bacterium HR40]|nr:Multicopper oxidase MmcO [bacterium HR40]